MNWADKLIGAGTKLVTRADERIDEFQTKTLTVIAAAAVIGGLIGAFFGARFGRRD